MKRGPIASGVEHGFDRVTAAGLALAGVEAVMKYDGSPVLKVAGCFMAGLATHQSAERDTIVVRIDLDDRALLLEEAPETYYVTEYYARHPVVLARLGRLDADALRDLLLVSWRLTAAKSRPRGRSQRRASATSGPGPGRR